MVIDCFTYVNTYNQLLLNNNGYILFYVLHFDTREIFL